MIKDRILDEIRRERDRQDARYCDPDHDDSHYPGDWCLILTKNVGCAAADTIDADAAAVFRENMIKIAAVAIAVTQSFDRVQRVTAYQQEGPQAG